MLLRVNTNTRIAERTRTQRLNQFGLDERALQDILFRALNRLFPDDELLLLMQSRHWQEEPDLMAIDSGGNLYIFEIKIWESNSANLLQVLRYGQMFGGMTYADMDGWYRKCSGKDDTLKDAHKAMFDIDLSDEKYNQKQVFITITNGLDFRTREVIRYWRGVGLDVRPWVYRAYAGGKNEMLLEMTPFRVEDNPYEDVAEGYYILNTNIRNNKEDHEGMLKNGKAAAYFDPWKFKIGHLSKGDIVFLYQSGVGIVAVGEADGKLQKADYQGNPEHREEEYSMKLKHFRMISPPLSAPEIKRITGVNHRFLMTMFGLDAESGKAIRAHLSDGGIKDNG